MEKHRFRIREMRKELRQVYKLLRRGNNQVGYSREQTEK
jgi:hypothetical protein